VELGCVFVEPNKQDGWLTLRWSGLLEHTNKELDERLTYPGSVLLQRTHTCFVAL
jgi:hypothetical protein